MKVATLMLVVSTILPAVLTSHKDSPGTIWAVLVAGSSGYFNYRHQADICHAYQIFHRHGIPDSQIIVMMYDDIAYNELNSKRGKIFNKPSGPNVYLGVPKDYTRGEVTPENFIHVLTGNSTALLTVGSGKVLRSGPNDHVFINFVDHGAPGLIGFPNGQLMYKDNLTSALTTMHKKRMFKKLVFYLEACESGSMFKESLSDDISILAATAANDHENSYACYFDNVLQTYLGDEFSVAWMEDIDSEEHQPNQTSETIIEQYDNIIKRVSESHPQLFGELDLDEDHIADFMGRSNDTTGTVTAGARLLPNRQPFKDSISSREAPLNIILRSLELTNDVSKRAKLLKKRDALIKGRKTIKNVFKKILTRVSILTGARRQDLETSRSDLTMEMLPCYKTLVDNFDQTCVNIGKNTHVFGHLFKLVNICALENLNIEDVLEIYKEECNDDIKGLAGVE